MSKPDKVIYIVNARIPNEMAHSIQITHTASELDKLVNEFSFVTPFTNKAVGNLDGGLRKNHITLPAIDTDALGNLGFHLRTLTFLISLYFFLIYQFLISKLQKKRVVLYIRGEIVFGLIPFFPLFPVYFETHYIRNHEQWYKWLLNKVDGVVVITDRLMKKFVSEYGVSVDRIVVARDAVDLKAFQNVSDDALEKVKSKLPSDKKLVLYTGRLSEEKGVKVLAESSKLLDDSVQVILLGGSDDQIKSLRETYKNIDNLSILGRVSHSDVPYYLKCADVLVLPDSSTNAFSNLYTSPMKLFEYMASGTGVVASNVPSLREVLDEGNSFLFQADSAESLANSIKSMLENPNEAEKRALKAKQDVVQFTWEKRAKLIFDLIQVN